MKQINQILKEKKLPKLTKKQAGFVEDYVATGNGAQSALKHYDIKAKDPEGMAAVIAAENIRKPKIIEAIEVKQDSLKKALIDKGITPAKIATKINSLLEAKTPIYKNNNATKKVELVGYTKDFNSIDKGLKHAMSIYGVEPEAEKPVTTNIYNFLFNAETQSEIKELERKIKEKLLNVQTIKEVNKTE